MFKRALLLLICLSMAFPVWAAQEFQVADILVTGNQRVPVADVLHAIKIQPGQTVTAADIDAAMADIYRMQRFSDISAEISDDAGARVLTFKVVERPLVRNIRFEGNDELKTEKLREVVTIRIPSIYDPFEVAKSVEMIKAEYIKVYGRLPGDMAAATSVNQASSSELLNQVASVEGKITRLDAKMAGMTPDILIFSGR